MQGSGCLDWAAPQACPNNGVCAGGECAGCAEGAERCGTSGAVQACQAGNWQDIQTCPFGCAAGQCTSAVTCAPGDYRCNANAVEVCNAGGSAYLYLASCTVGCQNGLCTGACTPGATRCNGQNVETCNGAGTAWVVSAACTTFCDAVERTCALSSLEITSNTNRDGVIVVDGPVIVRSGATLNSPTGDLTIRAKSITVELGASITASPTGATAEGQGLDGTYCLSNHRGGGGGSYGGVAQTISCVVTSSVHGSTTDVFVTPGSRGGMGANAGGTGGMGGGVIRLIAGTINIAGQITANGQNGGDAATSSTRGGGGGGSGGGILVAADQLTLTVAIAASFGTGGLKALTSSTNGANGGLGRVKLLYGSQKSITGTVTGTRSESLLPPLILTSPTHPDQNLIYNDDFDIAVITWEQAFPSVQAYYRLLNKTLNTVPTPANATYVADELIALDRTAFTNGINYFHIVPVNAASVIGEVESRFRIRVNTVAPTVSSTSHAVQTTWSANNTVFYEWALPYADENVTGYFYVLDHFGETVPTANDTPLLASQKQLIRSNLAPGIWAFHLVAIDTQGRLTKAGGHYRVRIGADPGTGTVLGNIVNQAAVSVQGATVTVNRGLLRPQTADQVTNAAGSYNFAAVPVGTWELRITAPGYQTKYVTIDVGAGASTTANINLTAL